MKHSSQENVVQPSASPSKTKSILGIVIEQILDTTPPFDGKRPESRLTINNVLIENFGSYYRAFAIFQKALGDTLKAHNIPEDAFTFSFEEVVIPENDHAKHIIVHLAANPKLKSKYAYTIGGLALFKEEMKRTANKLLEAPTKDEKKIFPPEHIIEQVFTSDSATITAPARVLVIGPPKTINFIELLKSLATLNLTLAIVLKQHKIPEGAFTFNYCIDQGDTPDESQMSIALCTNEKIPGLKISDLKDYKGALLKTLKHVQDTKSSNAYRMAEALLNGLYAFNEEDPVDGSKVILGKMTQANSARANRHKVAFDSALHTVLKKHGIPEETFYTFIETQQGKGILTLAVKKPSTYTMYALKDYVAEILETLQIQLVTNAIPHTKPTRQAPEQPMKRTQNPSDTTEKSINLAKIAISRLLETNGHSRKKNAMNGDSEKKTTAITILQKDFEAARLAPQYLRQALGVVCKAHGLPEDAFLLSFESTGKETPSHDPKITVRFQLTANPEPGFTLKNVTGYKNDLIAALDQQARALKAKTEGAMLEEKKQPATPPAPTKNGAQPTHREPVKHKRSRKKQAPKHNHAASPAENKTPGREKPHNEEKEATAPSNSNKESMPPLPWLTLPEPKTLRTAFPTPNLKATPRLQRQAAQNQQASKAPHRNGEKKAATLQTPAHEKPVHSALLTDKMLAPDLAYALGQIVHNGLSTLIRTQEPLTTHTITIPLSIEKTERFVRLSGKAKNVFNNALREVLVKHKQKGNALEIDVTEKNGSLSIVLTNTNPSKYPLDAIRGYIEETQAILAPQRKATNSKTKPQAPTEKKKHYAPRPTRTTAAGATPSAATAEISFTAHALAQVLFSVFDDKDSQTSQEGPGAETIQLTLEDTSLEKCNPTTLYSLIHLLNTTVQSVCKQNHLPATAFRVGIANNQGKFGIALSAQPPYTLQHLKPLREEILGHLAQQFLPPAPAPAPSEGIAQPRIVPKFDAEKWQLLVGKRETKEKNYSKEEMMEHEATFGKTLADTTELEASLEDCLMVQTDLTKAFGNRSSLAHLLHTHINGELKDTSFDWQKAELQRREAAANNDQHKGK